MPIKDVDGGIIWQGYNPHILSGQMPKEQYISKPFYFGGSNIPTDLGLTKSSYSGSGIKNIRTQVVKKLPLLRK